jgi:hypothetical protein
LLLVATAAPAQTQSAPAGTQDQTTSDAPPQTSCGLACVIDDSTPAPPRASASTKLPRNLEKLARNRSDLDKVVCEKQETIGTRLGAKKVCMTVAQWLEFQADVKDQTRRLQILGQASH